MDGTWGGPCCRGTCPRGKEDAGGSLWCSSPGMGHWPGCEAGLAQDLAQDPWCPPSLPGGGRAKVGWVWVWTDPGFWGVTIQPSIPPHDPARALCSAECRDICENLHPWVRGLGEPDLGQIIRLSIEGSSKLNTHACHLSQGFGVIAVVRVPLSSALGSQWLLPCLFAEV